MRRFSSLCLATLVLPEPTLMFRPAVRKNWRGASLSIYNCRGLHRQPAINLDNLAGDITRIVGQQKTSDAGDFVTLGKPTQRNLL